MRAKAYLLSMLLWACNASGPCKVQGGRCTRVEVECGSAFVFVGYDPACGENNKCCVPEALPLDAGSTCATLKGACVAKATGCGSETEVVNGVCAASELCCVPISVACAKQNGHCVDQAMLCPAGETPLGPETLCSSGNQCCVKK